jgi:hypothetical protein
LLSLDLEDELELSVDPDELFEEESSFLLVELLPEEPPLA